MTTRRRFLNLAAAAATAPVLPRVAAAQAWPTRTIRAMIPFSAGSTIDIVGRLVLDPLSTQLGQTIVVENRGGAGGSIGTAVVAKSEPDGYTLLVHAAAHSAAPAAYPNISYDPAKDFSAIIPFGTVPNVTVVATDRGIKTLQELVAKAKQSELSYASAGVGSATHWAAERLRVSAGFKGVHVPFRGGPEALTEVVAGRVDFSCMGIAAALPHIQNGKLLALAVSTPKRTPALPNVPTTIEAGFQTRTTITGWACSSRPRRRARSSTGSTPRPRRRCAIPTWSRSSGRKGDRAAAAHVRTIRCAGP
jgi:tripartite-type tricarboxylate transporter receptor subunit TctC